MGIVAAMVDEISWYLRARFAGRRDASTGLRIFLDEICGALTDHHAGEIGIGVGDRRHDRGVTDPEIFHAVDTQMLVDDGHGVGYRAHFASADAVKIASVSGTGELGPIFVGGRRK